MNVESQISTALEEIKRGTQEIIGLETIEDLVSAYFKEGKTFTIKAGFDPTAPDLHLGHTFFCKNLLLFKNMVQKFIF